MSRLGKKPLEIIEGATVTVKDPRVVVVEGAKGKLEYQHRREVAVEVDTEAKHIQVKKVSNTTQADAYWGTTVRIIRNMMQGVTQGFEKQLELEGVGYRMNVQGKVLDLALGFSHPVKLDIPEGVEVKIENSVLTVSGIDKQEVGQFAANIKSLRPVEPYKGKGFRYVGEVVRRKEGKKAAASA